MLPSTDSEICSNTVHEGYEMLYSILALLVAFWVVGLLMNVGGGLIHTLLVLALVIFVFDVIRKRRAI